MSTKSKNPYKANRSDDGGKAADRWKYASYSLFNLFDRLLQEPAEATLSESELVELETIKTGLTHERYMNALALHVSSLFCSGTPATQAQIDVFAHCTAPVYHASQVRQSEYDGEVESSAHDYLYHDGGFTGGYARNPREDLRLVTESLSKMPTNGTCRDTAKRAVSTRSTDPAVEAFCCRLCHEGLYDYAADRAATASSVGRGTPVRSFRRGDGDDAGTLYY